MVNFWSLLPQDFVESDRMSRFKKGLEIQRPRVYKWILRGLSHDIPYNILDTTAFREYKAKGERSD